MLFEWQEQAVARLGFLNAAEIMGRSVKSGVAKEHYTGGSELDEWHKQAARVAFLSTAIIAPSWTREQEREADFRAFD